MAGQRGNYSNIIIYDERRRYYYLHPQRNRPLLDDEVRDMGIGLLDQARRSVQRIYGDVAAPLNQYASSALSTESAFKVVQATAPANNFTVTGGTAGGDSLDHPSVLYAKGFYIFFTGDVDYNDQRYTSSTTDLDTVSDKYKTLTAIPNLTTPTTDRIDIVYMHLHFEEVTSVSGSDLDVYLDTGLDNPIIGRDTANRLRAVFDIRVYEGWDATTYPISEDIFNNSEFLGGISPNDSNPIENEYKIPIAVIYRHGYQDNINTADIVDLLTLYNKRVPSLEEVGYRLRHGGYTQADVNELGYTGFQAQFPSAVVDEGAFATGLNQGIDTEALNSDAVTPRVLDNDGKFFMDALMVGHETGLIPFETGPEALHTGEVVAHEQSLSSLYVGYEKGYTGTIGATGAREYRDNVSIYAKGESGTAGLSMTMMEGDTGSLMEYKEARTGHTIDNYQMTDYKGRMGINTMQPGWDGPDPKWGTSGINIVVDVNDSVRVKKDLFVGDDAHFDGGVEGNTFSIPAQITDLNPAIFGNDEVSGATGAISALLVKRGIGVLGVTGVSQAGYTGVAGYECYDYDGRRLFTIGDLGPEFDRVVMWPYGVRYRESFTTDYSLLDLPAGLGAIQSGDVVAYDIERENGAHVTGSLTTTTNGLNAVEEVRDDIIYNSGWGNATGLYRTFQYTYYGITGIDSPVIQTRTGEAWGVQIIESIFGFTGAGFTGAVDDSHGKLILKEMPEDPVNVRIEEVDSFTVTRGVNVAPITFTSSHYYGSTTYGGDQMDMRFVKLDLGEAADGWLFNGDVFFNGIGSQNRVTFSPNAIFRDDVFIYGTLFVDQLQFNFVNVGNLTVGNLRVGNLGEFTEGLGVGANSLSELQSKQTTQLNLKLYVKGDIQAQALIAESESDTQNQLGDVYLRSKLLGSDTFARIGGTIGSTTDPFGIHLVDGRDGVGLNSTSSFRDVTLDYKDGGGNAGYVNWIVEGDMNIRRGFIATYLAAGDVTEINTDYALDINGRGRIQGTLEVENLRFIGASAPEGNTDILTPSNVVVIDRGSEAAHNNENILRNKKFTITERVYLNNNNKLNHTTTPTPSDPRENYYVGMRAGIDGWFGHDTMTYREDEFDALVGTSGTEIVVDEIIDPTYQRLRFNRIIIATLGTLKVEWTGYAYDPTTTIDQDNVIQRYYFESAYFRNRDGGSVIDWMPGDGKFGDENLVVQVEGDIIDTNTTYPNMYKIDTALGLYIPKDDWYGFGASATTYTNLLADYRTFVEWYPVENVSANFNAIDWTNQTLCSGGFQPYAEWKLALYPRLVKQTRLPFDTSAGSNDERMYQGEWDMDLVIYPTAIGRCSNLIGKLYVSYMQS